MAIYHLSVKTVSRSAGRSATAAAAYRSGARIACQREGRVHDYTRKRGVEHCEIIVPAAATWARDRETLWNAAEAAEKRVNSTVAREYELALPAELSAAARIELVQEFAAKISYNYGVAADVAIHAPHRAGDQRNWHAHILTTTRAVKPDGLGAKTRILDDRKTGAAEIISIRAVWADLVNAALERARVDERVDHRSLEARRQAAQALAASHQAAGDLAEAAMSEARADSLDREPGQHAGPAVTAMERRAQREAVAVGAAYQPTTDIGRRLQAARQAKDAAEAAFVDAVRALRAVIAAWVTEARAWIARTRERAHAVQAVERELDQERRPPERSPLMRIMDTAIAAQAAVEREAADARREREIRSIEAILRDRGRTRDGPSR